MRERNPNANGIEDLEKITIGNEQGSITPEQAVFNILDRHFNDIKKERSKRKADAKNVQAIFREIQYSRKRQKKSQSQTLLEEEGGAAAGSSDVGTSASHADSGSSS